MIQIDMGKVVDAEKVSDAVEHSGVDMSKGSVVLSGDKNNQVIIRTTDALDINKTNELVNTVGKELNAKNIKGRFVELPDFRRGRESLERSFR